MFIQWLGSSLPLAETEVGFVATLLSQIWLWARVAFGIGLVIFVHELGHFLAAKTFGVKCEKFYVGFDVPIKIGPIKFPRTLGKFTYGETEYGIGILPLGGYVKMLGQDDDPRKAQEEADRIRIEGGEDEDDSVPIKLDPRSYPAKPVWQRMVIISAGVIMNLITGVLFAAVAYGYGVSYNPAIIGSATPGGPAWQAGVDPGGQVVKVGELADDKLHFREMRIAIVTAGLKQPEDPIDVTIRYDDGERRIPLKTAPHPADGDMRMIGITSPTSTTLGENIYASPGSVAATVLTEADGGAKIVAYDGNKIDPSAIVPGTPLFDYLNSNPTKEVKLELERVDGTKHTISLPPQNSKSVGIQFGMGPIVALIADGPAEKAGMKVGDVVESVNGEKSFNAFTLPIQLANGTEPVAITVRRGSGDDAESIELKIAPEKSPQTLSPLSGSGGEIGLNSYGFAYRPTSSVAISNVSSLAVGDLIKEVHLDLGDDIPEELQHERYSEILKSLQDWKFDEPNKVTTFLDAVQFLPPGSKFAVIAERPGDNNKIVKAELSVGQSDEVRFERGLGLTAAESVHTAQSFSEALSLGMREGKRRLGDVFQFLGMAVRGKVKRNHVGGPIKIVQIAGQEAKQGISKQLIFLTMLSMNLAILNFLPIPALDGGHMVFLFAELVRGKRVNEELEMRLTLAGVLALLALMAFVFFNDIVNF